MLFKGEGQEPWVDLGRFLTTAFAVMICVMTVSTAQAEDDRLMNLYPATRGEYLVKSEDAAARYKARGDAYVEHTYATGGEERIAPPADFMAENEPLNTVPVDAGQVADIVKESAAQ